MRPDFRHIEWIFTVIRGLLFTHDLHAYAPLRKITALDRLEQIALSVIRIGASESRSLLR